LETGNSKIENGKAKMDKPTSATTVSLRAEPAGGAGIRDPQMENEDSKTENGIAKMETGKSKIQGDGLTPSPIKDFKDLEVWKAARGLRRQMYKLANGLPDIEKFGLANQIRRAAGSVTANIAEGYGRFGYQENIQFCRQARGSVYELRDQLTTCEDESYITLAESRRLEAEALRVIRLLNGYLRATMARKAKSEE
jgi:four helix bundle protein